jgi:hypothetical protein
MIQLRLRNGFDRMPDADLQAATGQIIDDLTENFTTAPGLPALVTAYDAYTAALSKAMGGSTIEKAIKNQKKEELAFQHHQMIAYVVLTSAGDRTMAAKSGYPLVREASPTELTAATNQQVKNGPNPGELQYSFTKVEAAKSYIYQCTPEPLTEASNWDSFYGNKRGYLFTGLIPGKQYWVRVGALGIDGKLIFSEPILSKLVQ